MGRAGAVRVQDESPARASPQAGRHDYDRAAFPELECVRNLLPLETLAAAAARAAALGTGADRVLIAHGVLDEETYLQRLTLRFGIRRTDFTGIARGDIEADDAAIRQAAQSGMLRVRVKETSLQVMCLCDDRARRLVRMAIDRPREIGHLRLVTAQQMQEFLLFRTGALIDHAICDLQNRHPALSAAPRDNPPAHVRIVRRGALAGVAAIVGLAVFAFPRAAGDLLALIFLAGVLLRLLASLLPAPSQPTRRLRDTDLPDYSVIVALYREAKVVPQLLRALRSLDYPREKLDLLLVVETDDLATRAAIARQCPPASVRVIVAPHEGPRTKPKALNVALPFARGRYVAVFDAEDRPDPDQLRKAVAAFRRGGDDLACVQACLAIENAGDSPFSRMFAAEYAGQFDIVMPGYGRLGLPWPLGGTSNHFDARKLREVGAWDPFNVTEDADLGLRFARFHYRTATIASTTWEESTVTYRAWLHQRTRWMKGWMQTWWVHARHPRRYWRRTGWPGLIARDLIIGGALLAALAYPVLVAVVGLMLVEYLVTGEIARTFAWVSPLHGCSIVGGLAVSIFIQARGLARRGGLQHAWILALTPLYWGCLSRAAWRAVNQLRKEPYRWEKTDHGVGSVHEWATLEAPRSEERPAVVSGTRRSLVVRSR